MTVNILDRVLFDSGEAELKPDGAAVLRKIAAILVEHPNLKVHVIGHTDNVPIAKSLQKIFPSNWELSAARATTVVRYLQDVGIPPQRLIASGRADYAPIASNDSADGRKKNRRIEITLIDHNAATETTQPAK